LEANCCVHVSKRNARAVGLNNEFSVQDHLRCRRRSVPASGSVPPG
jgi:hypothetical protein